MTTLAHQLFLWINGLAGVSAVLDNAVRLLATDYFVPTSLSLTLVGIWFAGREVQRRRRYQRAVLAAPVAVLFVNMVVVASNALQLADRARPFQEYAQALTTAQALFYPPPDPSFPSNSAAVAFALAGLLWWADRRLGLAAFAFGVGLGFARIYVGVHYPLDIAVGASLGLLGAACAWRFLFFIEPIPSALLKMGRRLFLA